MKYLFLSVLICITSSAFAQEDKEVKTFISGLDSIRQQLKIPGMAAAVKKGNVILLEKGFGYADLEKHIPATAKTVFRVASITKTFTSTLLMQLVEQGKLNLDDRISKYGVDLGNPGIEIKHLLTHTSEGQPGTKYHYNGYRYGRLTPVLDQASGMPFYRLLMANIIIPLKMTSTAPQIPLDQYYQYIGSNPEVRPYFDTTLTRLARPYEFQHGKIVSAEYLNEFGAFGGLATSVSDLLNYSDAIDKHQFVSAETQTRIFTANRVEDGSVTPYGMGWFVENYEGIDFYWHYGQTSPGESAIFVKVPILKLAMAVLCNSDRLSAPFPLGDGDLFMSPVGQLFYRCFVLKGKEPARDFQNKELIDGATMALVHGDTSKAQNLYLIYARKNFMKKNSFPGGEVIASIRDVEINKNPTQSFTLSKATKVRVYGVGEDCSEDGTAWCDYGWIENSGGQIIWQMQDKPEVSAGGARKNQKVDQVITLPAGLYSLHYKSDSGHAFNNWDSLPPEHFFWGILLVLAQKQ